MFKNKKGQSTVEYIVLVTAVIAAVYVFSTGTFKDKLNESMGTTTNQITNMTNRMAAGTAGSDPVDETNPSGIKTEVTDSTDDAQACLPGKTFDATVGHCVVSQ